ncbi:MAG TPA: hypothetical protein VJ890_07615 [Vineibacter sp.]|nr:hypothetical protein [Vineibacter sp.]
MGALFSTPKPPAPPAAAPDPDKDSPLAKEAARRRRAKIAQRGGRASTMLTDPMSGADYSGGELGG